MKKPLVLWLLRIIPAVILLQTLFFKFTGAEEARYIFETVGAEPWGRYVTAVAELVAGLLLLVPRTTWIGAVIAAGVTVGAIGSHLTVLGIEVMGDGGLLFGMGIVVFACSVILLILNKETLLKAIGRKNT